MSSPIRAGARMGVLVVLLLYGCTRSDLAGPDLPADATPVSLAILDASTTGAAGFYFLPPIVKGTPRIIGTFNPNLLPALRVCRLEALLGDCAAGAPVASFGPGSVSVDNGKYTLSWDTGGPQTGPMDTNQFYRLEVLLGDEVVGWVDLDPQDPDGPGQSSADAYAFRLGETVPVHFWLGMRVLCETAGYVTECITGAVVDESGANLSLTQAGYKLGLIVYEGGLPGPDHGPITVTLERIDPDAFLAATGEKCIPLFDAPQFGACFRITTRPELEAALDLPALVSICLDPLTLPGLDLSEEQQKQLTMVRFDDEEWEALPDAPGDCPVSTAGLLPVPQSGLLRYAALGVNAVARMVGPAPLAARDIRLGGFTSSFSRFRYALPGQMVAVAGDGTVLQAADDPEVETTVQVVDHEGIPIRSAVVHFSTSDGSISVADATTDADGHVTTVWSVDKSTSGPKTLTASALGLLAGPVPEHSAAFFIHSESIEITAAVVGAPASLSTTPGSEIAGAAGESAGSLTVTVLDEGGYPVAGVAVEWQGDGAIVGGGETDESGEVTVEWILPETAGSASVTATVGTLEATFTASVTPGAAALLSTTGGGGSAPAGSTIPLTVTVTDAFGNVRVGDAVSWTATGGGGSIAGAALTDPDGTAVADWTLGTSLRPNTAVVAVGSLQATFTVEGVCFAGFGGASVDGAFGAAEWSCAERLPFTANISGGSTPAEVYWMNDGTDLYLAVRVRQGSMAKVNDLRFDFDNDGDGTAEAGDDVIAFESGTMRFRDESLSQTCVNKSQSGCSVGGEPVDGAGAVGNDGTWTVFEMVHPLASGDPRDFVLSTDDRVGFFVTLRIGNGAQGNTQFPGFRRYASIVVRGF